MEDGPQLAEPDDGLGCVHKEIDQMYEEDCI